MEIFKPLFSVFVSMLNPMFLIPAVILLIIFIKKNKEYKASNYYQVTKQPYLAVRRDTGRYGEYLTYKYLKYMEANGAKFLFNVYIPKENGETTEIDVLMISSKGIFVFESKNYSGWIFGKEHQKNWYQTLPAGKGRSHKEQFYNPVMQNRSHIKHLRAFLGEEFPVHSIIVFSERCTLKDVQIQSNDIRVIKRYDVASVVSEICGQTPIGPLNENTVIEIYNKLYPFTQMDESAKTQHIENIRHNLTDNAEKSLGIQKSETPEPVTTEEPAAESAVTVVVDAEEKTAEIADTKPEVVHQQALKCPRCGGDLILRTATRGANAGKQFYGCSNYPKCKYIQNVEN